MNVSQPTSSSQADDFEVGQRIIDFVGFFGTSTEVLKDNVVFICEELGLMRRCIHSVVALPLAIQGGVP